MASAPTPSCFCEWPVATGLRGLDIALKEYLADFVINEVFVRRKGDDGDMMLLMLLLILILIPMLAIKLILMKMVIVVVTTSATATVHHKCSHCHHLVIKFSKKVFTANNCHHFRSPTLALLPIYCVRCYCNLYTWRLSYTLFSFSVSLFHLLS